MDFITTGPNFSFPRKRYCLGGKPNYGWAQNLLRLSSNNVFVALIYSLNLRVTWQLRISILIITLFPKDVCEPGWSFYKGSCYFTSETCETWSNASIACRAMGANLAAIESQEENVYIQHRHNGDKAWIGLNDIATEGLFSWMDRCPDKFRFWAQSQSNDFSGEDCVHTLGAGMGTCGMTWIVQLVISTHVRKVRNFFCACELASMST